VAIISFKIECETSPRSINIKDWRFLTECLYYYGQTDATRGTRLILPTHTIDIMGWIPSKIHEMINTGGIVKNVLFSPNYDIHPGFCDDCAGVGKMDWVTSAMGNTIPRTYHEAYARQFKRNKERVLFYKSVDYTHGYDFMRVFAPTQIADDKSETICKNCCGTGLRLDARSRIFAGMRGLKQRLKEFEWDGINLPNEVYKR